MTALPCDALADLLLFSILSFFFVVVEQHMMPIVAAQ
jgi:hypothetical protein